MLHGERDAGDQEVWQRARSAILADGTGGGALQRKTTASACDGAPALRKRTLSRTGLQGAREPIQEQKEVQGTGAAVKRRRRQVVPRFL